MNKGGEDFSNISMLDLFRTEVDGQTTIMSEALVALEQTTKTADKLEALMRASHSLKGAARMVGVEAVVRIAHALEDCFVSAQNENIILQSSHIDILLKSVDLITNIAECDDKLMASWSMDNEKELEDIVLSLESILIGSDENQASKPAGEVVIKSEVDAGVIASNDPVIPESNLDPTDNNSKSTRLADPVDRNDSDKVSKDRVLRVSSERMDSLLSLAGEAMIESRWLKPYLDSMQRHKRFQYEMIGDLDMLREFLGHSEIKGYTGSRLSDLQSKITEYCQYYFNILTDLEQFDHRASGLASRLHNEVITSRMRPFSDCTDGLQRMVRDIARSLDKKVKLEIKGLSTQVDRDVLEMIKAPLNHLLRNAVDHGIEMPDERIELGKPEQGTITLSARHHSGMLSINITDDGKGVDISRLKEKILAKGLANEEMIGQMTNLELLDFLFLPGFSTRDSVTDLSGRGVGLDVVHDSIKEMRGIVTVATKPGKETRFNLQLPLTLSVVRTLLVDIGGECYAFPLARIDHLLKRSKESVQTLEDHQYIIWNKQNIGLVVAAQLYGLSQTPNNSEDLSIIIISDRHSQYGVVVDKFLGERELAVQVLDPRLGKVKDISVAALLDDGTPTLIVDVDDIVRSIDKLVTHGEINKHDNSVSASKKPKQKSRILVIDDSITVREVQRKLLSACGYEVDVAIDGIDGWNALRGGKYALVITDVDMPRMDGIELVQMIKKEQKLKNLPVMIVSYKDNDEDKRRGLGAGADYYLTKGSFHDESLREAVADLIGEA